MSSDNATQADQDEQSDQAAPEAILTPPPAPETPRNRRTLLISALVIVALLASALAGGVLWRVKNVPSALVVVHRTPQGGAFPWSNVTRTTAPSPQYAVFAQQNNPVDPAFQAYYARVNGAVLLGNALTPAYLTQIGWTQIFANGALVAPTQSSAKSSQAASDGLDSSLLHSGQFDSATGIVRLPLLDALLTFGSTIPVGGDGSSVTYVSLRTATDPSHLAHLQLAQPTETTETANGIFVSESASHGTAAGHIIPTSIWTYITNSTIAPDGWQATFGNPLTEALTTTATINGASHHLLVQAFALATVAVDLDADDANGQPTGSVLPLGRDYLATLGPPSVVVPTGTNVWLTGNAAIVDTPGGSTASVHLGQNFSLALSGQSQWLGATLWYATTWKSLKLSGSGWAPASLVTMTPPAKGAAAWAGFDALSPDVAKYLASFGKNVGSVVFDMTRNQYYSYNETTPFVLASSSKVSLLVSYLLWLESQGRGPNASENNTLTNMIEHSDNNAAQLIFDRLGGSRGQTAFYKKIGVTGYIENSYGWGWASLPPLGQMQVLTLLQEGKVLTAHDRAYALNLMNHIEPDQHMGVGETLPPGATVAMKDGWVPAPDGLWAINTSGIVTAGSETYIIVVYTAHQHDYDGAWNITRHVCKVVGQLLTQG
ncbi:MAG TPA: serine hydrolase [Ktedonobacterales bacterium]|jgi:beta-lactamase class A